MSQLPTLPHISDEDGGPISLFVITMHSVVVYVFVGGAHHGITVAVFTTQDGLDV